MDIEFSPVVKELLDPDQILEREFEYARDTTLQANNDRTQVVNLYLILLGGVGSILLALPSLGPAQGVDIPRSVFAVVLFIMGLLGLFTVLKLIRLRQAWHDSVLAMNRVKDFYILHYPELAPAFRWRTETVPAPGRVGTISFDLAALVALLDSLAVGGGAVFLGLTPLAAAGAAIVFFLGQGWLYFWLLPGSR